MINFCPKKMSTLETDKHFIQICYKFGHVRGMFWWVTFGWNFISFFGCLFCFTFISKFADYSARMHRVGTHGRGTCSTTIKLETSSVNPPEMTARNIQTILCYMLEKENISDSISKDLFDRNLRISFWSNWLRGKYTFLKQRILVYD